MKKNPSMIDIEYLIPLFLCFAFTQYTLFNNDNLYSVNICNNNSLCNMKFALKKCNDTDNWSIHGLWLDYSNGSYPQFCSKMKFDYIPSDLDKNMKKNWYSCNGDDKSFWNHELQKHGSCIRDYIIDDLDSNTYFDNTIKLFYGMQSIIDYTCKGNNETCLINLK